MSEPTPTPTTVRLYGLFPMTRSRYVFQLIFAGLLASAMLLVWGMYWPPMRAEMLKLPDLKSTWFLRLMDAAPWLILGGIALQALEAWFVLPLFAKPSAVKSPAPPATP